MEIYPAIDLIDGRCVRLTEGDFHQCTVYNGDPLQVATRYRNSGAKWMHVVDLDAARNPERRQDSIIQMLAKESDLAMQVGGGIRSPQDVASLLAMGVRRVIIGSLAVTDIDATQSLLRTFGSERIVLAFDVKGAEDGIYYLASQGWQDLSIYPIENHLRIYADQARHILCTDIHKDGRLAGPNILLYGQLTEAFPDMAFQASGGVSTLQDIDQLRKSGVAGAIIGKALFEGRFSLQSAIGQAQSC